MFCLAVYCWWARSEPSLTTRNLQAGQADSLVFWVLSHLRIALACREHVSQRGGFKILINLFGLSVSRSIMSYTGMHLLPHNSWTNALELVLQLMAKHSIDVIVLLSFHCSALSVLSCCSALSVLSWACITSPTILMMTWGSTATRSSMPQFQFSRRCWYFNRSTTW